MTGGQWRRLGSASQLRLVLQVAALFIAVTVASFAYAWWVADQALRRTLEVTLDQEIAELQAEGSAQEVIDEVSQVTAADLETLVLRYEAPKPEAPVGTIALPFPPDQVAALVELQRGSDKELFLAKGAIAYGGQLSVAIPASDIEELFETFLRIFLWSIAPACLAALSGGLLLAQRSVRRGRGDRGNAHAAHRGTAVRPDATPDGSGR